MQYTAADDHSIIYSKLVSTKVKTKFTSCRKSHSHKSLLISTVAVNKPLTQTWTRPKSWVSCFRNPKPEHIKCSTFPIPDKWQLKQKDFGMYIHFLTFRSMSSVTPNDACLSDPLSEEFCFDVLAFCRHCVRCSRLCCCSCNCWNWRRSVSSWLSSDIVSLSHSTQFVIHSVVCNIAAEWVLCNYSITKPKPNWKPRSSTGCCISNQKPQKPVQKWTGW